MCTDIPKCYNQRHASRMRATVSPQQHISDSEVWTYL